MKDVTLVLSFYRQSQMLIRHIQQWIRYANDINIILVDDASPEPAETIIKEHAPLFQQKRMELYRIIVDIPWARETARNLGGFQAKTEWIIFTDLDHILPGACLTPLFDFKPVSGTWYLFNRYRQGKADATRRKDRLPRNETYGQIHPHMDSFLIERSLFLKSPYDEDYNGCLGGGTPFISRMKERAPLEILPENIYLEVYTRDVIPDASITTLSRDQHEYARRKREKEEAKQTNPYPIIRLPWVRIL